MVTNGKAYSRALHLVALVALVLSFGGCWQKSVDRLLDDARKERDRGNYRSAIVHLKSALQKSPDNSEARYLLGATYNDSGDFLAAETELRKAIDLGSERARVKIGKPLLTMGKFQKVLDEILPNAQVDTAVQAEILTLRARASLGLGRSQEGRELIDQALAKQPEFSDALLVQARLAARDNKADEASQLIGRALASAPNNVDAWMMKGDLARSRADQADALAAYQKVLDISPEIISARMNIVAVHIYTGKFGDARKQLDHVRKLAPDITLVKYWSALIEFREKKYTAAREALNVVLKEAPDHMQSVLLAGAVELNLGSHEQAQKHLARVVEFAPGYLFARKLLLVTLTKSGRIQRAIEVLQPGVQQAPEDGELMSLAGDIYLRANEFSKAVQFFEKAVNLEPKSVDARVRLGLGRLATGETDRAMADLEFAVSLDPASYQADIVLVMSQLRKGRFDEALRALQALEKKQPKNPITYDLKAAAYLGKMDKATARTHLEHALELNPRYVPGAIRLALLDLQDKKTGDARRRLEAILETDRNNTDALMELAKLAPRIGATSQEQIAWLERARKASPGSVQPSLMLMQSYAQYGDPRKGVEIGLLAHAAHPKDLEVLVALGAIQMAAGESEQALATYQKLVALQPKAADALFRLATAYSAIGDRSKAADALRKALALKPAYLDAQVALAVLEIHAGRYPAATKIARQIQMQFPKSPAGSILEGDSLTAEQKFPQAAKAFETALSVGRNSAALMKLHGAYMRLGQSDKAERLLAQWLKESPDDAMVRFYAAGASNVAGKYKDAIEHYSWLLKRQPDNVVVLNYLAWTYQQAKDARALETAERAHKLRPDVASVADTLGWLLVEQGNTKRGVELLEKAITAAPKDSEIRYHLAQALVKTGNRTRARQELEKLLADAPGSPYAKDAKQMLSDLDR